MKRTLATLIMFMSLNSAALAEDCTLHQIASLPMEGDPTQGDGVVVPVKINGTALKFFVTTASNVTGISAAAVKRLGLQLKNSGKAFAYTGRGDAIRHYVIFKSFELGVSADHNANLIVMPESFTATGFDGVLAMDYLLNFDVEFDFKGRTLKFFSKDHCKGNVVYWTQDYAEVPFTLTGLNQIRVPVTLDGKRLQGNLSMGGQMSWISFHTARTYFGLSETSPGVDLVRGEASDSDTYFQYRFKALDLDGIAIRNPLLRLVDDKLSVAYRREHNDKVDHDAVARETMPQEDMTMGMSILSKLRLYFAFKERMLYVSAANAGM